MQYRTHRGEKLPEIGIGCYSLSGVYGKKDPERFVSMVRWAYDLGVTFFDTADVYGSAEEILSQAVASFRNAVWIATKVGASVDGKPNCSADHVLSACEQSLRRLRTDYIDLYQIHFNDPNTLVEETIEALERLMSAGKIRYYGVGHLPPPWLQKYFTTGNVFSELMELSAVARGARDRALRLCREHDVGVIAFSVTGRGLLTGKICPGHVFEEGDLRRMDPLFQRERFASGLRVVEEFKTLGAKYGKTPAQVAIAWVLAQPGVVCALTGPSTITHLEENLGGSGWSITPDDLAGLEQFFQDENARLQREQIKNIHTLLAQDLELKTAFADLVYIFETLLETGTATEEEILPLFQQLWALRKRQDDPAAVEQMQAIRGEVRDKFGHTLAM